MIKLFVLMCVAPCMIFCGIKSAKKEIEIQLILESITDAKYDTEGYWRHVGRIEGLYQSLLIVESEIEKKY